MPKFPWKTALAAAGLVATAGYVFAAQLPAANGPMGVHGPMQHGATPSGQNGTMPGQGPQAPGGMHGGSMAQGMHGAMGQGTHNGMHNGPHAVMGGQQSGPQFTAGMSTLPTSPGQDAFGAIQEIVQLLQADPTTDWSKVDISALREHLIDMNEVTLHAVAHETVHPDSIEIAVTGAGRTLDAIKRMVPAHVRELRALGWDAVTDERPDGVTLKVKAKDTGELTRLKALGFIGIMAQGAHHQPHHLMMAKGEMAFH